MTKSALVKIGVPSEQAQGMRKLRRIRQILDQRDAAVARLDVTTADRIREALSGGDDDLDPPHADSPNGGANPEPAAAPPAA